LKVPLSDQRSANGQGGEKKKRKKKGVFVGRRGKEKGEKKDGPPDADHLKSCAVFLRQVGKKKSGGKEKGKFKPYGIREKGKREGSFRGKKEKGRGLSSLL